jgi:hypothetical protein
MFSEQERKALELGRRMAEADFSINDNPFTKVHPRFAAQWLQGFTAASTLKSISSAMSKRPLATAGNGVATA